MIANIQPNIQKEIVNRFGECKNDWSKYKISLPGVSRHEILDIVHSVLFQSHCIKPYDDAVEYLPKFYKLFGKICFVTARDPCFEQVTTQ